MANLKGVPVEKDWTTKETCDWLAANVPGFRAEVCEAFATAKVKAESICFCATREELERELEAHKLKYGDYRCVLNFLKPAGPLVQPSEEGIDKMLQRLKLDQPWKKPSNPPPTAFGPDDVTKVWFLEHVRDTMISLLATELSLPLERWPSCQEIFLKRTRESRIIAAWLQKHHVTVKYNSQPAWLQAAEPIVEGDPHLKRLSQSSLLDFTAYSACEGAEALEECSRVAKSAQETFNGVIPAQWKITGGAGAEYVTHLQQGARHWEDLEYHTSEGELTGGALSDVFDWCYARYATQLLKGAGATNGLSTKWRRNVRDDSVAQLELEPTLPDGRLEVTLKEEPFPFSMLYVEDKSADFSHRAETMNMDQISVRDLETAILEAQRAVVCIQEAHSMSSEEASKICVVAIHTRWPRVWVYGVSPLRDRSCIAYELGKYNFRNLTENNYQACLRTLLMVKRNLEVLAAAERRPSGSRGRPVLLYSIKDGGDGTGRSAPSTPAESTPKKPDNRSKPQGNSKGRGKTVLFEKRVWKLPTRNGEEEDILRQLGGRHHFPALIADAVAPPHVPAGAFAMTYYADRHVASVAEARVLVRDLAEALQYLHGCGYVHRDVKRPNVRFTGDEAVLIDLDLAVHWRDGDAPLESNAGTPAWRAPEVRRTPPQLTSKADMYGLGLVLLDELLVLGYPGNSKRVGLQRFDCRFDSLIRLLYEHTGLEAVELVAALLDEQPSRRPDAAQVLRSAFVRHGEGEADWEVDRTTLLTSAEVAATDLATATSRSVASALCLAAEPTASPAPSSSAAPAAPIPSPAVDAAAPVRRTQQQMPKRKKSIPIYRDASVESETHRPCAFGPNTTQQPCTAHYALSRAERRPLRVLNNGN